MLLMKMFNVFCEKAVSFCRNTCAHNPDSLTLFLSDRWQTDVF